MYSELYESIPDISAYLERLGLNGVSVVPCKDCLDKLIYAHLTHIPFENLDVYEQDQCPDLGIPALFDKIITHRRGGYCFELNSLFFTLLRDLGFEVYPVVCRVVIGKEFLPPPTHRAAVVILAGKKYYCDVGYGGPAPACCLCFDGTASPDGFSMAFDGDTAIMCRLKDGAQEKIITFRDAHADPVDFVPLNFHQSKSPQSYFKTKPMANLRTADGSISIDSDVFRRHSPDGVFERQFIDRGDFLSTLKTEFGINI